MTRTAPRQRLEVGGPESDEILSLLENRPGCTGKYLAERLERSPQPIRRLLGEMEAAGLVRSEVSPANIIGRTWAPPGRLHGSRKPHTILKWYLA